MIKNDVLSRSKIVSIVGAVANDYEEQKAIVPAWKRGISNYVGYLNAGSDDTIGFPHGYGVHDDLLILASWSSGLGVHRLNDDGSFTNIYNNTDPLGSYGDANNQSIVLHKPSMKFVLMSYDTNGYGIFDYSPCFSGNAPTLLESGSTFMNTGGSAVADVGSSYFSGLSIAGDWVYGVDESATHYKAIVRRNIVTAVQQRIDFTTQKVTGSATIDRNGYRGTLSYDSINDRMYYQTFYNANMTCITAASTANPLAVWCDMGDAGLGDDAYEQGIFVIDPVNAPNVMTVGCNSRHALVDITPCFTGTRPTVLKQFYTESAATAQRFGNYFRAGVQNQAITSEHSEKNPLYPEMIPTTADRGRNMLEGWIDTDNNRLVGLYRYNNTTEDTTTGGRGRSLRFDYSNPIFRMQSSNGTYYWIKCGHAGSDGSRLWSYSDAVGNGLIGNWEVVYGNYTLTNSANIGFVNISYSDHYIPSSCSLSYYVSNNGGATYELYSGGTNNYHFFNSTGNTLRVKYVATGFPDKAPYKMGVAFDAVNYGSIYESVKDAAIPYKVTRKRLRGKKQ